MRILLYGLNYSPELTGIGKYSGDLCAWLAERGHDVRVIAAPPYYPQWRVAEGYHSWAYSSENIAGVSVFRAPLWVPKRQGTLHRLIHLASYAFSSLPIVLSQLFWRPQVVVSVAPALFTSPAALLVARLAGAKSLIHFQDFEIDAAFGLGMMRFKPAERLARALECRLINVFDRASTISLRMEQRLRDKGVDPDRTLLFPNWADCEAIRPMPRAGNRFRRELGIADSVKVALYSGAMGEKQGLELVVEAAQKLVNRRDILFVLAGSGAARDRLEPLTVDAANMRWLPLQPESALNDWLNLADVHLLPQRGGAADLVMPSKLTGMLASGRPVVTTAEAGTQLAKIVNTRLGVVTAPDDIRAFAMAIQSLCDDSGRRAVLGEEARQYALDHYERSGVLKRFENQLLSLVHGTVAPCKAEKYDS